MKKNIIKVLNNKFFQGGFFLTASNFLVGFLNYIFNSLSAKTLGPAKYSEIVAVFAYLWILAVPTQVISTDLIRRLGASGEKKFDKLRVWQTWFAQKLYHWRYLLIPYFGSFFIVSWLTNLSILYSFVLLTVFLTSFLSVFYTSSLLGLHLFLSYSMLLVVSTFIKLLGPIFIYLGIDGLNTIALFVVLSSISVIILGKVFLAYTLKKTHPVKKNNNPRLTFFLLNKNFIITGLSLIGISLLNNLDVIFAKKFFSSYEAGIYGSWSLFGKIIYYILSPILSLGYIFFTSKEENKNHKKILLISFVVLITGGISLYFLYTFFGKFLILLVFNGNYMKILPYLPQAAIFGILFTTISLINSFFIAKNSINSLIITFFILIYAVCLFLFVRNIFSLIRINIFLSILVTSIYLISVFFWKTKSKFKK